VSALSDVVTLAQRRTNVTTSDQRPTNVPTSQHTLSHITSVHHIPSVVVVSDAIVLIMKLRSVSNLWKIFVWAKFILWMIGLWMLQPINFLSLSAGAAWDHFSKNLTLLSPPLIRIAHLRHRDRRCSHTSQPRFFSTFSLISQRSLFQLYLKLAGNSIPCLESIHYGNSVADLFLVLPLFRVGGISARQDGTSGVGSLEYGVEISRIVVDHLHTESLIVGRILIGQYNTQTGLFDFHVSYFALEFNTNGY
jgi:hypothetical protein